MHYSDINIQIPHCDLETISLALKNVAVDCRINILPPEKIAEKIINIAEKIDALAMSIRKCTKVADEMSRELTGICDDHLRLVLREENIEMLSKMMDEEKGDKINE